MSFPDLRLDMLQTAARSRLEEARVLLAHDGGRLQGACYLAHVALECALKVRLLRQAGVRSLAELRRRRPNLADEIFRGRGGHNLVKLAAHAALRRLLVARACEGLMTGPAWAALCAAMRPYSLRYGHERPARRQARDQVEAAGRVLDVILDRSAS